MNSAVRLARLVAATLTAALTLPAQAQSLDRLLLNGHWCTYSSGKEGKPVVDKRYTFRSNNTYILGGDEAEAEIPGLFGRLVGQIKGNAPYMWEVRGNILFITDEKGNKNSNVVQVRRDGNGKPVINANNVEYAPCP